MQQQAALSIKDTLSSPIARLFVTASRLICLFLPLVVEQLLKYTVGLADSIMVTHVGEAAVSGVSLVNFMMSLLTGLFSAIAVGGSAVISQYMGRHREQDARQTATQLVALVGGFSLVVIACIYLFKEYLLTHLFGTLSADVYHHADTYFTITALSIPFLSVYAAGAALFRCMNNTKLPMQIMLLMNVVNVAGNALFIYGFRMGTEGIAIPTLVSRVLAAVIMLILVADKRRDIHIVPVPRFRFCLKTVRQILNIGIPFGMETGVFHVGRILVAGMVASFGTVAIAANAVAGTIVLFQVLPGMAVVFGMTSVIARHVGARDYKNAKYNNLIIIGIIYLFHLVSCTLVIVLLPHILALYGLSEQAARLSEQIVRTHALFTILVWPLSYALPTTFRAAGDARYPMIVNVLCTLFGRVACSYLLGIHLGLGVPGIWLGMFVDWIIKGGLFLYRYISGKWLKHTIITR